MSDVILAQLVGSFQFKATVGGRNITFFLDPATHAALIKHFGGNYDIVFRKDNRIPLPPPLPLPASAVAPLDEAVEKPKARLVPLPTPSASAPEPMHTHDGEYTPQYIEWRRQHKVLEYYDSIMDLRSKTTD